jgi:hypothetical protein
VTGLLRKSSCCIRTLRPCPSLVTSLVGEFSNSLASFGSKFSLLAGVYCGALKFGGVPLTDTRLSNTAISAQVAVCTC